MQWSDSVGPYLYEQGAALEVKLSAPVSMNITKGKRFVYTDEVPLLCEQPAEGIMLDSIPVEHRGVRRCEGIQKLLRCGTLSMSG